MTRLLMSLVLGILVSIQSASAAERTVTLTVNNMYCEACPYMVKKDPRTRIRRVKGKRVIQGQDCRRRL